MGLTERTEVDKIEVVGQYSAIQVRIVTIIEKDGEELTRSFHRHVISAGDDYSNEDAKVQAVCAVTHTPEVVAAYQAELQNASAP